MFEFLQIMGIAFISCIAGGILFKIAEFVNDTNQAIDELKVDLDRAHARIDIILKIGKRK